nr:MAG TPA: hypothetical protein [Caudoviricetes sp.]
MDLIRVHRYTLLQRTERHLLVLATGELILMVLMLLYIIAIMNLIRVC